MKDYLPYLAAAVALASAVFSYVSTSTARRGLAVARMTGQATYEGTRLSREPPLNLIIDSVSFREPTAVEYDSILLAGESRAWAERDADHIEVVVCGRMRNNLGQELLVTFWEHPTDSREVTYQHRNHSVWRLDGRIVEFGRAVLSPKAQCSLTWVDRRPRTVWTEIYKLRQRNEWNDPELELPKLGLVDRLRLLRRPGAAYARYLRARKIPRVGFQVIAETRATERVATVWTAEVTKAPIATAGRDEQGRVMVVADYQTIEGPIDDDVIYYRVAYDPVLASVDRPSTILLKGREQ